ncbi:MAG: peptide chain release factor N(5)-glutamine methyltransferase [Chlorobi bacterium]|nr:peptide chain release factor N(5)-glutamine methyltransferase [Chlorobiota bacterium]
MTLRDTFRQIEQRLRAAGIAESRREAELLVHWLSGCSTLDLHARPEHVLDADVLERLEYIVHQRTERRIPLQYLLGSVEFYGLEIAVTPAVLIPRPETETLVARIVATYHHSGTAPQRILDIGTGSGCIALALARMFPSAQVVGWDCSAEAIAVACSNALQNGIANVIFEKQDVFNAVPNDVQYDLVMSNPPYIATGEYVILEPELHHEPRIALTDGGDGLRFFRRYAELLPILLTKAGMFALECAIDQAQIVAGMFKSAETVIACDDEGVERYIVGTYDQRCTTLRNFALCKMCVIP